MKPQFFRYRRSVKVGGWGCFFDSLLEAKFAIAIRHQNEYLRARIPIYYDRKTLMPTNYLRHCTIRYTPDFLMRHKQTGEAWWVELKPRAFQNEKQLLIHRQVAENYIRWKGYDWKFRIVFDDDFVLSADDWVVFNELRKRAGQTAGKIKMQQLVNKYDRSAPNLLAQAADRAHIHFVMFGNANESLGPGFRNSG